LVIACRAATANSRKANCHVAPASSKGIGASILAILLSCYPAIPATLTNNDGGTTIASGNFTGLDGGLTLYTVATLPASAKPSVGFAGNSSYIRLTAIVFGP
jgi:hypothetical protein